MTRAHPEKMLLSAWSSNVAPAALTIRAPDPAVIEPVDVTATVPPLCSVRCVSCTDDTPVRVSVAPTVIRVSPAPACVPVDH